MRLTFLGVLLKSNLHSNSSRYLKIYYRLYKLNKKFIVNHNNKLTKCFFPDFIKIWICLDRKPFYLFADKWKKESDNDYSRKLLKGVLIIWAFLIQNLFQINWRISKLLLRMYNSLIFLRNWRVNTDRTNYKTFSYLVPFSKYSMTYGQFDNYLATLL